MTSQALVNNILKTTDIQERQKQIKRLIDSDEGSQTSVLRYEQNRYITNSSPSTSHSTIHNSATQHSPIRQNSTSELLHDTNEQKQYNRTRHKQNHSLQSPASISHSSISLNDSSTNHRTELSFNRIDVPSHTEVQQKQSTLGQQIERWTSQTINKATNRPYYNQLNSIQSESNIASSIQSQYKTIKITVYMPHIDTELIQLECQSGITAQQLIHDALIQYKRDNVKYAQHADLQDSAAQYKLYICEEDGEVDDDLPALNDSAVIGQTGSDSFAMRRKATGRTISVQTAQSNNNHNVNNHNTNTNNTNQRTYSEFDGIIDGKQQFDRTNDNNTHSSCFSCLFGPKRTVKQRTSSI